MINVGDAAREVRERIGLSQKDAAVKLGISNVHLCNIEKGNAQPSPELLAKYQKTWGVDLYVLAWCQDGDVDKLPSQVRHAATALANSWKKHIEAKLGTRSEPGRSCSPSAKQRN